MFISSSAERSSFFFLSPSVDPVPAAGGGGGGGAFSSALKPVCVSPTRGLVLGLCASSLPRQGGGGGGSDAQRRWRRGVAADNGVRNQDLCAVVDWLLLSRTDCDSARRVINEYVGGTWTWH